MGTGFIYIFSPYVNYRKYKKTGGIPFYVQQVGASLNEVIKTKIDGLSIWIIDGKEQV